MAPETVAGLIADAKALFAPAEDIEITLEANPTSVEAGRFRDFRQAGGNRGALGGQSLDAGDLARLGRQHSVEQALSALEIAKNIFPRLSFDLIYARPQQTLAQWKDELNEALAFGTAAVSLGSTAGATAAFLLGRGLLGRRCFRRFLSEDPLKRAARCELVRLRAVIGMVLRRQRVRADEHLLEPRLQAAIGNAVARALGARIRHLPLTRERIEATLLAQ